MATPPKFRLSLKSGPTTWYAFDSSDAVITQGSAYHIYEFDDWEDVAVTNAKNIELFGLDRDYTIPYKFPYAKVDGIPGPGRILRHIDHTQGSEGVCQLVIEIRDDITWSYSAFTPNPLDLDFSAAVEGRDHFTIPVKEAGLPVMLRAGINTEFKVNISSHASKVTVDVNPLVAQAELKWVTEFMAVNYPTPNPNVDGHITDVFDRTLHLIGVKKTFIPTSTGGDYSPVKMGLLSTSSTPGLGTPEGQYPTPRNTATSIWNKNATTGFPYMFKAKVALTDVTIKGSFEVILFNGSGGPLTLNFTISKMNGGTETVLYTGPTHSLSSGAGATFTETIAASGFNLAIGDELMLYYTPNAVVGGGGFEITIEQGRYITATFRYETEPFSFYALRGSDVFESLISQITNGAYTASSSLITQTSAILDSIPNNILWTSGIAIRSQPFGSNLLSAAGDTYLKISLADFVRTYNVIYGAGMSAESGVAKIERINRYFDSTDLIADLGEVVDGSLEKAVMYQYNTVRIGWPNQTYDEVNGLDEFNTTQLYTVEGNVRTPKELNLVSSNVRADMWGIFFEWVKYVLEESKDSSSDNDTFILEVKTTANGAGHYEPVTGADIPSMSGVIDPVNSFNATLSPKHCLYRNGGFIRSGLYPLESKTITFQTTDKNASMVSNTGSGTITESANAVASTLATKLFKPWIFNLDIGNIPNLLALLDAKPYGFFRFTLRGEVMEGFPLEASIKPAKPEAGRLKLLSSPNNDLTLLD